MDVGAPSNRKEWILLIFIVVLLEFIFLDFVFSASANKELVNLFSFGSTLISIVLALIAIFYSFLQTESQKEDGRFLAKQIQSLTDVSNTLKDSGVKVDSSVSYMQSFVDSLGNISGEVSQSRQAIESVEKKLGELSTSQKISSQAENQELGTDDEKFQILKIYLPKSGEFIQTIAYCLYLAHKNNSADKVTDIIKVHYVEPLASVNDVNKVEANKNLNIGLGMGIYMGLVPLGIYVSNKKVNINEKTLSFLNDFFKTWEAHAEKDTLLLVKAIEASYIK